MAEIDVEALRSSFGMNSSQTNPDVLANHVTVMVNGALHELESVWRATQPNTIERAERTLYIARIAKKVLEDNPAFHMIRVFSRVLEIVLVEYPVGKGKDW